MALLKQVGALHHSIRPDLFRKNACKYGPSQLFSLMESSDTPIFVVVEEDKVLGYCFCRKQSVVGNACVCARRELYIDDLCIDQKQRGTGIGKSLYEAACAYAKERSFHSVTLNVWCCNPGAMAFYEKLGMKPQKIGMENVL